MTDAEMAGLGPGTLGSQTAMPETEASEAGADPRIAELQALLAAATAEAEKGREDWLRAKAESDNIRRRAQEDVAKAHRYALEGFANALLAAKDSMDAALTVENTSIESFKEGVELTARQLQAAFEKFAIREIVAQGEKFDPHRHQAISQVESDQEPNTVVSVLQKGYLLHDRVLRPALVIVAKNPHPAA